MLLDSLIRFRRKYIPYLIWYRAEVDVRVTFTENKLPIIEDSDPEVAMLKAHHQFERGAFYKLEKALEELGIDFDKGLGFDGRDWEWDWSLTGPIHIAFLGRAKKPKQRY